MRAGHILGRRTLEEWCVLDTHDTLSDMYKHLRTTNQISAALFAAGLQVVGMERAGNVVEARAVRGAT